VRKIELKGDDGDQPTFTVVELAHPDGEATDRTPTREETPAQDQ
jgi:hypothetical protein